MHLIPALWPVSVLTNLAASRSQILSAPEAEPAHTSSSVCPNLTVSIGVVWPLRLWNRWQKLLLVITSEPRVPRSLQVTLLLLLLSSHVGNGLRSICSLVHQKVKITFTANVMRNEIRTWKFGWISKSPACLSLYSRPRARRPRARYKVKCPRLRLTFQPRFSGTKYNIASARICCTIAEK